MPLVVRGMTERGLRSGSVCVLYWLAKQPRGGFGESLHVLKCEATLLCIKHQTQEYPNKLPEHHRYTVSCYLMSFKHERSTGLKVVQ